MKFSKEHSLIVKGVLIIFMLTHHLFLNTAVYESKQLITLIHNLDNWENYVLFFKICVSGFVFISAYGIAEQISGLYSRDVETSSKKMLGYGVLFVRMRRFLKDYTQQEEQNQKPWL